MIPESVSMPENNSSNNLIPWLPTERTCACPKGAMNCLSEREWLRNQVPIWWFRARELNTRFDSFSRQQHPAVFPSVLAKRVIKNYSHENETVLDVFCGVGTTLYAASVLGRNSVGFDLNSKFTDFINRRLKLINDDHCTTSTSTHRYTRAGQHIHLVCSDSRKLPEYLPPASVDLAFTSPPYWDLLNQPPSKRNLKNKRYLKQNYSNDASDLSNELALDGFFDSIKNIFGKVYTVLKPGGRCVIDTGDYRRRGEYIPLSNLYIKVLRDLGFELKNIIIWDRRNEYDIGLFSYPQNFIVNNGMFEYLLEFKKNTSQK